MTTKVLKAVKNASYDTHCPGREAQSGNLSRLFGRFSRSVSPLAIAAGVAFASAASPASAQSCTENAPPPSGIFTCSGPGEFTSTVVLSGVSEVTVADNVSMNVASGHGFDLSSVSQIVFTQASDGLNITASGNAINAVISGGAVAAPLISITTTGNITSTGPGIGTPLDSDGIHAEISNASSGTITITTNGSVTSQGAQGDHNGIDARINTLTGTINITTNGAVHSDHANGIFAGHLSASNAGSTTITANDDVFGDANGIKAYSFNGNSDITITTYGSVSSNNGSAIVAYEYDYNGKLAEPGVGNISITTHGDVTSQNARGIEINTGYGISINATETIVIDGRTWGATGGLHDNRPSSGSSITITQNGTLGSDNGIAISGGDFSLGHDKTTNVLVQGALEGDVTLGLGEDSVTLQGSSATLGSNGATLGTAILFDGDNDGSSTNGEADAFTFDSWTGSVDLGQFRNFETFSLINGSNVTLLGTLGDTLANANTTNGLTFGISAGSVARAYGTLTIDGNLINDGTLSAQDGTADDVLSVLADYSGSGTFAVDTDFYTDMSDRLTVGGDVTGPGITTVSVSDVSSGAATGNNVLLVDIAGASPAGLFMLDSGLIIIDGYAYSLGLVGSDWYLTAVTSAGCPNAETVSASSATLEGCVQPDTLTVTTGGSVTGDVEGAGDVDIILIEGDAVVGGIVHGGGDGSDLSAADDAGDFITIDTTGSVGGVDGDLGDDQIWLLNGSITGDVLGNVGDDRITLNGSTVAGVVDGGDDDDAINLLAGSAGSVTGGGGADIISLNGAAIAGGILGGDGDDAFEWRSGTTPSFLGGDGSDTASISASEYDGTQLLDGGDDTSIEDGMIDSLTLTGLDVAVDGTLLTNWEAITIGNGSVVSFSNGLVTSSSEAGYGLFVAAGGALYATESLQVNANLTNAGLIDTIDGATGDTVTVSGDYTGAGGVLAVDADVDNLVSDQLLIAGDVTGGSTSVAITDVSSGVGSYIGPDDAILVVGVDGMSASDAFSLEDGALKVGAFDYTLSQFDDGNFYLTSNYQSGVATIEALGASLVALSSLPTLQQRVGNRNWTATGKPYHGGRTVWGTIEGSTDQFGPKLSTTQSVYDLEHWKARIGLDLPLSDEDNGGLTLGWFGHYGEGKTEVTSALTDGGKIDHNVWGGGLSLTWYGANGFYADGQVHYNTFDEDLFADATGSTRLAEVEADGFSGGLELGYRIGNGSFAIIPQAQLSYSDIDYDGFTLGTMSVAKGDVQSLRGRIGVALSSQTSGKNGQVTHIYGILNLLNEFEGKNTMWISGTPIYSHPEKLWGEAGAGFTHDFGKGFSLFGEGSYETAFNNNGDNYNLKGRLGLRLSFGGDVTR